MTSPQKTRMTPQRRVILEEIERTDSHPGADEVYELVRKRLPRISLGTVYRNLEILSECGLIRKVDLGDGHRRFDGNLDDHYHVRCTCCGRIADLRLDPVSDLEKLIGRETGYEIVGHRLDFFGLCPNCREENKDSHSLHQRERGLGWSQEFREGDTDGGKSRGELEGNQD